jgi:hypothetical protein
MITFVLRGPVTAPTVVAYVLTPTGPDVPVGKTGPFGQLAYQPGALKQQIEDAPPARFGEDIIRC